MSALEDARQKASDTELLDAITNGRRRQTLRLVRDRPGSVTEEEIATRLASDEESRSVEAATRSVRIQLRHAILPRLDAAGLLEWDEQAGAVTATDHPAFDDPQFQHLLETEGANWSDVVASLAADRRRTILAVLESGNETVSKADLVREVAAHDGETSTAAIDRLRTDLHHVHLPKLEAAGLIEYDDDTVTYRGHPQLPTMATLNLQAL